MRTSPGKPLVAKQLALAVAIGLRPSLRAGAPFRTLGGNQPTARVELLGTAMSR